MMFLGLATLLAWTILAWIILLRRGYTPRRLIASLFVLVLAGLLGAIPGAYIYIGLAVTTATGVIPGAGTKLAIAQIVSLVGCLAGVVAGLFVVGRMLGVTARFRRIVLSLAGMLVGMGIACLGLLFAQNTVLETYVLVIGPVAIASSALVGFCLQHDHRSG